MKALHGGGTLGEGDPGDEDFTAAALRHVDRLYRFAYSLCRNRHAAEDLVQETYLRAWRAPRRPALGENLQGWLFTILHNAWRNEARRRQPEPLDAVHEGARGTWRGPAAEADVLAAELSAFVDAMPDHLREVVLLRFAEDFSYQEIAEVLGCPAGTVMSRLSRARALLRKAFLEEGPAVRHRETGT